MYAWILFRVHQGLFTMAEEKDREKLNGIGSKLNFWYCESL